LFQRKKTYKFNEHTLQFEAVVVPFKEQFNKALRFLGYASLISTGIVLLLIIVLGSPSELMLKSKITAFSKNYEALNLKIDKLENQLQGNFFKSDIHYRELLQIDSLPYPIRTAGMGGSEISYDLFAYPYSNLFNTTLKKVESLKKQVEIQQNSFNTLSEEAKKFSEKLLYTPAIQPVKPSEVILISSGFGGRNDPFTFINKSHEGIDFVGADNTPIYATANGVVSLAEENPTGYGKEIVLLHDFGFSTRYAHLNKILVAPGQKVTRGQVIGLMGNTGRSTGTHLHYEVRLHYIPINPNNYFADDLTDHDYELLNVTKQAEEN
jgi:murein DD-endopeptidase MepM/ murein hydrolase activator NlpD